MEDPRLSALIISPRNAAMELLEAKCPARSIVVASDHREVAAALASIGVVTLVAASVGGEDAVGATKRALAAWPAARCVWFAPLHAHAVVPRELARAHHIEALGTFHDDDALTDALRDDVFTAHEIRLAEIAAAGAFAERFRLGPVARTVIVHLALGLSTWQSRDVLDYESKAAFHDLCRKQILPKVEVSSMWEVKLRLDIFMRTRIAAFGRRMEQDGQE